MSWTCEELATALDRAELWRHLDVDARAEARARVVAGEYPFDLDALDLWVFADGEDLAEGGVEEFLAELAPLVAQEGVELRIRRLADPYGETQADQYVVEINGQPCLVWRREDWTFEPVWAQATVRPLARVNELLAQAGSLKRVYTLYTGGNEGLAHLLNPDVIAAVRASGLLNERDTPELAATD